MIFVSQHNGSIHILAVKASVQRWWPNTTIKLNLNVRVQHFLQKCSLKGTNTRKWKIYVFSREQVYWWWMSHVAASNFWLHVVTTLVPTFFCNCFAHIGPRPTFTPPPTLCSMPLTCTHWIQNPNKACAWALSQNMLYYKCHTSKCTNNNSHH